MFSAMLQQLKSGERVDPVLLQKRFDLAMTKKLGTIKLPSAFWSADPKINPPAGQLLLASLFLGDRERCALAVTTVAAECENEVAEQGIAGVVQESLRRMLVDLPEAKKHLFTEKAIQLLPEYFPGEM